MPFPGKYQHDSKCNEWNMKLNLTFNEKSCASTKIRCSIKDERKIRRIGTHAESDKNLIIYCAICAVNSVLHRYYTYTLAVAVYNRLKIVNLYE